MILAVVSFTSRFPIAINVMFETPASLSFFCDNLTLSAGFIKILPQYHILVAEKYISYITSQSTFNTALHISFLSKVHSVHLFISFPDLMHIFKEKSDKKQYFSDKVKQIQQRFTTTMKVNINKLNDLPK